MIFKSKSKSKSKTEAQISAPLISPVYTTDSSTTINVDSISSFHTIDATYVTGFSEEYMGRFRVKANQLDLDHLSIGKSEQNISDNSAVSDTLWISILRKKIKLLVSDEELIKFMMEESLTKSDK